MAINCKGQAVGREGGGHSFLPALVVLVRVISHSELRPFEKIRIKSCQQDISKSV